ncbi:MAG TPA: hypothetical protein VIY48_21525 [Candidatus Paceibacterota bacterium]
MTEREELELAAKAARCSFSDGTLWYGRFVYSYKWNPKDNDADAFRLGVNIGAFNDWPEFHTYRTAYELEGKDALTATRLAIFKLAVEIGGKV